MRACSLDLGCKQFLSVKHGMQAPFMWVAEVHLSIGGFRCFVVCWVCFLPGSSPLKTNSLNPRLFLSAWCSSEIGLTQAGGWVNVVKAVQKHERWGSSFTAESVCCETDSLMYSVLPVCLGSSAALSSYRVFPDLHKHSQLFHCSCLWRTELERIYCDNKHLDCWAKSDLNLLCFSLLLSLSTP